MKKKELKKANAMAFSLAEMGLSAEKIAKAAKLSENLVQKWLNERMEIVR